MSWDAAIGAAGAIGSSLLGSKGSSLADRHFAEDQYWRGIDQAEKNWTRDMNTFLGAGNAANYYAPNDQNRIGPVAIGVSAGELAEKGLDMIGRERDLDFSGRGLRQAFDIMGNEYGMTPQEIAGSPVPGGTSSSGGNAVLGQNGAAAAASRNQAQMAALDRRTTLEVEAMRANTQIKTAEIGAQASMLGTAAQAGVNIRGQNVEMSRAELQAETQKQVSEIAAAANITSTKIQSAASVKAAQLISDATKYTSDQQRLNVIGQLRLTEKMNDAQIAKLTADTAMILQTTEHDLQKFKERWPKLFATMSDVNIMASALAVSYGIPVEEVLKGTTEVTPELKKQLKLFVDEVVGNQSWTTRETQGAENIIKQGFQEGVDTVKGWFR